MSAPGRFKTILETARRELSHPVDGASLAFFRFCFGGVMLIHAIKYLWPQGNTTLLKFLYRETTFNFTYPGLHWIQPFPEPYMQLWVCLMAVAAFCVAVGICYRLSATTLCITYTYLFLTEVAKYNNHYYLMCLFAFLLIIVPADQRFSFSSLFRRKTDREAPQSSYVPFWSIFLLRAQLFIVYFFGGIAKINEDWLTGIPMISKSQQILEYFTPMIGMPDVDILFMAKLICWFGLVYDISIGFLLIFRRTRLLAIVLTLMFHLSNHFLFPIGLFPAMAFLTTLIFFEPDWPVRFVRWFAKPQFSGPDWRWLKRGIVGLPLIGALLGWSDRKSGFSEKTTRTMSPFIFSFVAGYLVLQAVLPFRHYLVAGDANWTEEHHDFSWRMMLRSKDASHIIYHVVDTDLISVDDNQVARCNWSLWTDEKPKTLYVPVESSQFNWTHHPGLSATFEPLLGQRPIYRLTPEQDLETTRQEIIQTWKKTYNRDVNVVESITLSDLKPLLKAKSQKIQLAESTKERIATVIKLQTDLSKINGYQQEQARSRLVFELEMLNLSKDAHRIRPLLRSLHPFALQGATFPQERFLVIDDPNWGSNSHDPQKLSNGKEFLVWMDLGRLRQSDWEKLPQWFLTFEDRELRIVWNYMGDLNSIQKKRFSISPWMIHQFAGHIAERWEEESSRRPRVRVVSNLMLNYRKTQPLIDPFVDLASTPYDLFGHNEWILPVKEDVGSASIYHKTAQTDRASRY